MAAGGSTSDYVSWSAEGHSVRITYSTRLMDLINGAAWEGLQKIPRRGLEIGGVLFGDRAEDTVRIRDWRPIACEHARGPGFELSPADEDRLKQLLDRSGSDPELQGMVPVGWFHTRTKDGILLSEADVDLYNRFFPATWQVVLVLRPHMYEPTRAGFFFREQNGSLRADGTYQEFTLDSRSRRLPIGFDPSDPLMRSPLQAGPPEAISTSPRVAAPRRPAAPARGPVRRTTTPPVSEAAVEPEAQPKASSFRWRTVLVAALFVAPILILLGFPLLDAPGAGGMALSVREVEGGLLVEWNRAADTVVTAERGTLSIVDGETEHTVEMGGQELHTGSLTYVPATGDVQFRLDLYGGEGSPKSEIARFLGDAPASAVSSGSAGEGGEELDLEAQAVHLRQQLAEEVARNQEIREQVDQLRERLPRR